MFSFPAKVDPFHSLARLYANRKQFTRIVASAEMSSDLVIANRIVKVYIDESKRYGMRKRLLIRQIIILIAGHGIPFYGDTLSILL